MDWHDYLIRRNTRIPKKEIEEQHIIINVIRVFVGKRSKIWVLEALDGFTYIAKGVEK